MGSKLRKETFALPPFIDLITIKFSTSIQVLNLFLRKYSKLSIGFIVHLKSRCQKWERSIEEIQKLGASHYTIHMCLLTGPQKLTKKNKGKNEQPTLTLKLTLIWLMRWTLHWQWICCPKLTQSLENIDWHFIIFSYSLSSHSHS